MLTSSQRAAAAAPTAFRISLVAGRGVAGAIGDGGPAVLAQLDEPAGVAVDIARGIAVAEASNRVRYITFGSMTTIAGSGAAAFGGDGGPATDAQLKDPNGVGIDVAGGVLIADSGNDRIRRLDRDGIITTIAGGGPDTPADGAPATSVRLLGPTSIAFDRAGGLIVGDERGHRLWRLTPAGTVPPSPGS
jgi:hypothetical protein